MAFGIRKFKVTARVMRTLDGRPTKVSIIPSKSMKRKGENKVTEKLPGQQKKNKRKSNPKRKVRAPRS